MFTPEAFIQRLNVDLTNDLGNLVSRTVAMVEKYFDGILPKPEEMIELDIDLKEVALNTTLKVEENLEKMLFSQALTEIWQLINRTNKYIDETKPWILGKDDNEKGRLGTVLYNLVESIRVVSILIQPFMTKTPIRIWNQIGTKEQDNSWEQAKEWGVSQPSTKVEKKK